MNLLGMGMKEGVENMSVVCGKCNAAFGDLQHRIGNYKQNFFGEKQSDHKCPKCGDTVTHNWDTRENFNPSIEYGENEHTL